MQTTEPTSYSIAADYVCERYGLILQNFGPLQPGDSFDATCMDDCDCVPVLVVCGQRRFRLVRVMPGKGLGTLTATYRLI